MADINTTYIDLISVLMADVIAKMSLVLYNHQLLNVCYGRCCCQVAGGIATVD